jgi:putative ATPase
MQRRAPVYDKSRDGHYNLISALHKSVRGSDPDAALYWFCRMLDGGEDPLFLARRLVRMAVRGYRSMPTRRRWWSPMRPDAYDFLGSPEGELALAQACVYLATAPKSNGVYTAYKAAMRAAKQNGSLLPPKHILNAPTKLMKSEGYSSGYLYDHDRPTRFRGRTISREHGPKDLLRSARAGLRARDPQAPRFLVPAQKRTIDKGIGHEQHHP